MIILAIDTSCDDTSAAIVAAEFPIPNSQFPNFRVLSNVVSSQVKLHSKYGGVYPMLAKREHQKNLTIVLKRALQEAGLLKISNFQFPIFKQFSNSNVQTLKTILEKELALLKRTLAFLRKCQKPRIDYIAVTIGPGLEPCLWQGVNFAKALGFWWNVPIIPVNHIEGHLLANFLPKISKNFQFSPLESLRLPTGQAIFNFQKSFPAVGLVVSGGHTELIFIRKIGDYKIIGETRDDAAGECLDKTARILGLGYPGGPAIAAAAAKIRNPKSEIRNKFKIQNSKFKIFLPRPMLNSKDFDFSFSGLKTAVLYDYKSRAPKQRKSKLYIQAMCYEIQQAIIDVLLKKTFRTARQYEAKTIILGGGVAANKELRRQFKQTIAKDNLSFKFYVPSFRLCTDNAAMVAATACFNIDKAMTWQRITAKANIKIGS